MAEWDKIMDVNLTGPMRLTKAAAPVLKASGHGRSSHRLGRRVDADRLVDRVTPVSKAGSFT